MRDEYRYFLAIPTRWADNDVYGHVNNVEYYAFFDTVINQWLISEAALDIHTGPVIGLCVESSCRFLEPVAFPETIEAGLRVETLGNSSVRYGLELYKQGSEGPIAEGSFVHVFVDRTTRRPAPIPDTIRGALMALSNE